MKKKNKTMRAAGALFVATMLTTSMTAGTFAKYTTTNSASDSARVAKFGVEVQAEGTLFAKKYVNEENGNTPGTINLTVNSEENVVAPGTKNSHGLTFCVTGTPEVTTSIDIQVNGIEEVYLRAGEYFDYTTGGNLTDKFVLEENYYPVKFTLTQDGNKLVDRGKLSDVQSALQGLSSIYEPGTVLNSAVGTLNLTWEWDFNGEGVTDKADTLLGNLAADSAKYGVGITENADYSLQESVSINISVTQVD